MGNESEITSKALEKIATSWTIRFCEEVNYHSKLAKILNNILKLEGSLVLTKYLEEYIEKVIEQVHGQVYFNYILGCKLCQCQSYEY